MLMTDLMGTLLCFSIGYTLAITSAHFSSI
jgi:hypothetical protein